MDSTHLQNIGTKRKRRLIFEDEFDPIDINQRHVPTTLHLNLPPHSHAILQQDSSDTDSQEVVPATPPHLLQQLGDNLVDVQVSVATPNVRFNDEVPVHVVSITHVVPPPSRDTNGHRRQRTRRRVHSRWTFGPRTSLCPNCSALMWTEEKVSNSSRTLPRYQLCCKNGNVKLPWLPQTPYYLNNLLRVATFRQHIRSYNSVFCFTSTAGKIDHSVIHRGGPYTYRISGENHHRIGSLLPPNGERAKYVQLYIYDTDHELQNRMNILRGEHGPESGLDMTTVEGLNNMLDTINPYVKIFRSARDRLRDNPSEDLRLKIIYTRDGRQYIQPTSHEVAALVVGNTGDQTSHRDIILSTHQGYLQRINELHPSYMPLQYPLLFPYGTDGWRPGIYFSATLIRSRECISMREFYAYRIQHREGEGKTLIQGGRLFQQFTVDCWAAIEHNTLNYHRTHQRNLRGDVYQGIADAIAAGDNDASTVGKTYILPSSFTGGARNMMQHYQDAMAICRYFGAPDLFITFTCNPNWIEIKEELSRIPGQRSEDRPDIICRVFRIKQKRLMDELKKNNLLGRLQAEFSVIEFQKRGLPHTHIALTFAHEDKPFTTEDIDGLICAEIPDKDSDPVLYEYVTKFMLHGPCGDAYPNAPCMVNGKCSKHYPKKFAEVTTITEDGFVTYRRRNDTSKHVTINGFLFNNQWVVPYNPILIICLEAHVNVEKVAHSRLTKYLYKYMSKGVDRANVLIVRNTDTRDNIGERTNINTDEIQEYMDCRYISPVEACWRTFEFPLQKQYPSVLRLQFHLPNHQWVNFNDKDTLFTVMDREHIHRTMLTEWFETNRTCIHSRSLTYAEFPTMWVWDTQDKIWTPRQNHRCIGRLPYAQPTSGERYYLRMLLHKVRGAQSFDHLKTVDGILHSTFRSACVALGLLDDDNEWDLALTEACVWASSATLRSMFCTMLMFSEVTDPLNLWLKHWRILTDDLQYRLRQDVGNSTINVTDQEVQNLGLIQLQQILSKNGRSLTEFPPMPLPSDHIASITVNRLIREELDYDAVSERQLFERLHNGLNQEQLQAYNEILHSYETQTGGFFFVCGSGGTGKTYLWRTMIAKLRSEQKIVLSVASSGISALLLPGGRTAHSRFKIPLNPDEFSTCHINYNSDLANLIREASMVIWDAAPMMHRYGFEAVHKTLLDILKHTCNFDAGRPFGGKLFVLGGDFRQTLPVVPKGRREATIFATITESEIWKHCRVLHLTTNMRVLTHNISNATIQQLRDFSNWILSIGDGKVPAVSLSEFAETNWIEIPDEFLIKNGDNALQSFIDSTYPNLSTCYNDTTYLKDRAILAPKNVDVDKLNEMMLAIIPGVGRTYMSADTISNDEGHDAHNINPPEYLNSLDFPGIPSHCLQLKEGAPVILLRNLNQSEGLYNGTRLQIARMGDKVVEARVLTGSNVGDMVLIPRITLTPQTIHTPIPLKRRQFPLKVAFAMTINKSQGQTLKNVGVYLPNPVFSHGQLYVAISRATTPSGLKMLIVNKDDDPWNLTQNVVYREVFNL